MDGKQFKRIVALLDSECADILIDREAAYAGEDKLENFKLIEILTGVPAPMVCLVLQAKHIIALFKSIKEKSYNDLDKYIVDIINYQRLLKANLIEINQTKQNEELM